MFNFDGARSKKWAIIEEVAEHSQFLMELLMDEPLTRSTQAITIMIKSINRSRNFTSLKAYFVIFVMIMKVNSIFISNFRQSQKRRQRDSSYFDVLSNLFPIRSQRSFRKDWPDDGL